MDTEAEIAVLLEDVAKAKLALKDSLEAVSKRRAQMLASVKQMSVLLPGQKRGRKPGRKPKGAPALTAAIKALPKKRKYTRKPKPTAVPAESPLDAIQEPARTKRKYTRRAKAA